MSTYRAKKVRIEMTDGKGAHTGQPINGYADGDMFAPLPMEVEVVPGAGRYLVPRP